MQLYTHLHAVSRPTKTLKCYAAGWLAMHEVFAQTKQV